MTYGDNDTIVNAFIKNQIKNYTDYIFRLQGKVFDYFAIAKILNLDEKITFNRQFFLKGQFEKRNNEQNNIFD